MLLEPQPPAGPPPYRSQYAFESKDFIIAFYAFSKVVLCDHFCLPCNGSSFNLSKFMPFSVSLIWTQLAYVK